ncbi:T9SS type A sorting domain-containing protein [Taibaiella soli]|uniref:Secretion system C-terminal sorting domain-containing protein n=1 Tax=Taibaiella soli TaxID=1649169 RepID=A0A2W2B546_9BACT|nr:T9SS type A sorting domain-containing protein [Taibaiella soli]PZF71349.1 hypothetical protein DN068_18830 [Taibaiella soli]
MRKFTLSLGLLVAQFAANAQTPFPKSVEYIYVGTPGFNASTLQMSLYTLPPANLGTGQFVDSTAVNILTPANKNGVEQINGVGISSVDDYAYGISFPKVPAVTNANVYRIGYDGNAQIVGFINAPYDPAYSSSVAYINTTAGVIRDDNYWFSAYIYGADPTVQPFQMQNFDVYIGIIRNISKLPNGSLARIDPEYHKVNYSDPALQDALQAFLNNFVYPNPTYSGGGFEDLAFNPQNGELYSYITYPGPGGGLVGRPATLDIATWKATPVGTTININPGTEIAGAMFDSVGNYYLVYTNGQYTPVDLNTGAITGLVNSNLPLANGNLRGDLASRPYIPIALAIDLYGFSGSAATNANMLQWTSGTERDFQGFVVQKSSNGKDFTGITNVAGKGSNSDYSYADANVSSGISYYRLQMIDLDGTTKYSKVISIARKGSSTSATIYPTVVNNQFSVRTNAADVNISVSDMSGRVVSTQQFNGVDVHTISITSLANSLYIVTVTDLATNTVIAREKLVKQ